MLLEVGRPAGYLIKEELGIRFTQIARLRTVAIINRHASSGVPSLVAAMSGFGRLMPTMVISFRFGSRSISVRGKAMRSRRAQTTWNACSNHTKATGTKNRSRSVSVAQMTEKRGVRRRGRALEEAIRCSSAGL